ncbi:DciA family protein [Candidatus Phycosocius spiralis]|uniref:DUF721 domain-containing protein n=1 Tax=Candidatus Phycosocius spiralis TaxID=2815099 RepID=A0ABQ4PWF4_9PROT|nr:DciA family protein [Candidatus Phycosocius spiralis]GIU67332.1 hypothetical protein PsB1_1486 [Candidatus Phycosocius spiralis]
MANDPPNQLEDERFDPQIEAAATTWLSQRRGKPVRSGPTPLAKLMTTLIPLEERKAGLSVCNLQQRWGEIVGETLASICQPEKIKGETLVLKVAPAAAPLLTMRSAEIIGLVRLAGGGRIKKLTLVRAPLKSTNHSAPLRTMRPLDASAQRKLDEQLDQVTQPSLKAALSRLAQATSDID